MAVGALGIIVELELQAISTPWVRADELSMPVDDFLVRMPELFQRYEHLWGHWSFGNDIVLLKGLETRPEPEKGFRPYVAEDRPFWGSPFGSSLDRAKAALRRIANLHPALAEAAKKARGPKPQRVRVTMQYGVAASRAPIAIERLRASDFAGRNPGRVLEMKFLKGSEQSYLGPNAAHDAVLFNTFWEVDEADKLTVFDPFEDVMLRLGARAHWGKLHKQQDIGYLRAAYPGWDSFEAVRAKFDPNQMFDALNRPLITAARSP